MSGKARPSGSWIARFDNRFPLLVVVIALALFTAPEWIPAYLNGPVQLVAIYAIVCAGVMLTLGFAGQFTLGYGAVYAVGAYTSGLLIVNEDWPVVAGMGAAMVTSAIIGTILGLPALRLRSHYLGMVTLGFAVVTPQLLRAWDGLTGGFAGVGGIERPSLGSDELTSDAYYYFVAACAVVVLWLMTNLLRSRWRLAFLAVHDDELAAVSVGVPVYRVKIVAFLIASILAGLGGALYASYIGYISPDVFTVEISILFLTIVVVGGQFSLWGAAIGSLIFVIAPQELASFDRYSILIYGFALILVPMVMPDGIAGGLGRLSARVRHLIGSTKPTEPGEPGEPGEREDASDADRPGALAWTPPVGIGEVVLSARGMRRAFTGVVAVDGVDLSVRAGTVHALLGPNGSGKTTLLNLLSSVSPSDAGEVHLLGSDVTGSSPHVLAHLGVGRTFQTPRLFGHLSVVENVMTAVAPARRARFIEVFLGLPGARHETRQSRAEAMACLRFVGLEDRADDRVDSLPLGKQRMLEIGRALAGSPAVVLLDEPAAGLAGDDLRELQDMIIALRDRGNAVLLVEHNVELVFALADEVTVLESGACIAYGNPGEVQASPAVIEAYLGA